jgi:hypothetical protein
MARFIPPIIARLKPMGVRAIGGACGPMVCRHSASLAFAAVSVEDYAVCLSIHERRRFFGSRCGGRAVSIMPDGRGHKAVGAGRGELRG